MLIPDTFAYKLDKKTRGSNQSQNQFNSFERTPVSSNDNNSTTAAITSGANPKTDSYTPRSPLKLFANLQDTFTRSRFQNILSHYEDSEGSSINNNGSLKQQGLNIQKNDDKGDGNGDGDDVNFGIGEIDNADAIETSGNLTTTTNSDNASSKNIQSKAPTLHSISSASSSSLISKAMNETTDYNLKGVSTAERFLADGSKYFR
ncbi:unnamed protein product [[Candida] boidinii]|nr:unnamed protein product [[Candida] boidinii]